MATDILERDDLSIYVVAGVPKSFRKKLQHFVHAEAHRDRGGEVLLLEDELAEWLMARVQEDRRRSHERTPGSAALWRAYRALSAARYHLKDQEMEPEVRAIRDEVELLWQRVSPLFQAREAEATASAAADAAGEGLGTARRS
jgi:HSP90 family molecular chaperone